MSYQIEEIYIYPRNHSFQKKTISFHLNAINVVYGIGGSGKSTLLDVINYCLCSSTCNIPVGVTRECVDYYGVKIAMDDLSILVARKCPDNNQKDSSLMFFDYGHNISTPEVIEANANCDDVKQQLNVIFGHSQKSLINEKNKNKSAHSTFRVGVDLVLQSKNCLTSNKFLFDIPSYVGREYQVSLQIMNSLGFITTKDVENKMLLNKYQNKYEKLILKQEHIQELELSFVSKAKSWIDKAFEYGLIDSNSTDGKDSKDLLEIFAFILNKKDDLVAKTNQIVAATNKTVQLQNKQDDINNELTINKQKLKQILKIVSQKEDLNNTFQVQLERIEISKWLKELLNNGNSDFYGYDFSVDEINELVESTEEIERQINDNNNYFINLEKEEAELEQKINDLSNELIIVQNELNAYNFLFKEKEGGYTIQDKLVFLGQLDMFIKQNDSVGEDLSKEIESLEHEISNLKQSKDGLNKDVFNQNKKVFENFIKKYANSFGAEYSETDVNFSFNPLKLDVLVGNSYQPFSSIGSSSNMLFYHTAIELAIQKYKNEISKNNLVPSFVVLDQPSQCFFPNSDYQSTDIKNEDKDVLIRYYNVLSDFVKEINCQLIILEHADETIWGSNAKLIDRFDEKHKLIPNSWIS